MSGITLSFKNIKYTVQIPVPGKRKETTERTVLQNQNGVFEPGQLSIIMGSSGAGKTSLLNILADRVHAGVSGDILLNGKPRDAAEMKSSFSYVTQDDILLETLTPREMLRYQARLQLPYSMSLDDKYARVDEILAQLQIAHCADTVVGTPGLVHGLSGGERKRLNIALSLLKSPKLIFLDEPTSGLDSTTAYLLVQTLKQLALQGRTIVATLHQPSPSIFALFDKLYLMSQGEMVFYGEAKKAVPYMSSIGYECPSGENPADWLIELMQSRLSYPVTQKDESKLASFINASQLAANEDEKDKPIVAVSEAAAPIVPLDQDNFETKLTLPSSSASRLERVNFLIMSFRRTEFWQRALSPVPQSESLSVSDDAAINKYAVADPMTFSKWCHDFLVLAQRVTRASSREKMLTKVRLGQTIGMSVVIGMLFVDMNNEQSGIRDRQGLAFFFCLMQIMGPMMGNLAVFAKERPVFLREQQDGLYSPASYVLSKILVDLPLQIVFPSLFAIVAYFFVGLQAVPEKFFIYLAILILLALNGSGLGLFVASNFADQNTALAVAPGIFVPMNLFSGLFIKLDNIPVWIRWIQWMSPVKYGLEALYVNEMTGLSFHCSAVELIQVGGQSVCPLTNGEQALKFAGFGDVPLGRPIGLLVVLLVFWRLLALRVLSKAAKRQLEA